jgi:hypothetical protein
VCLRNKTDATFEVLAKVVKYFPEDGSSKLLRNVGNYLSMYIASYSILNFIELK